MAWKFWLFTFLIPLLVGCGVDSSRGMSDPSDDPSVKCDSGPLSSMQFDATVPASQACLLHKDFNTISELQGLPEDSTDAYVMGVSDFKGATLNKWISDRVKYVTGEEYNATDDWDLTKSPSSYPAISFADTENRMSIVSATTMMVNIGTSVYLQGKQNSYVIDVQVAGSTVRVFSPRVGIIKVGVGLFGTGAVPKGSDYESKGARLMRIATLFHEARHGDGNGTNAGFIHSKCPSDFPSESLRNEYACDSKSNGPYEVEAILQKKFYQACTDCTSADKQFILLRYSDDSSRLLDGSKWIDPKPEKIR